jgi:hypothetical protein
MMIVGRASARLFDPATYFLSEQSIFVDHDMIEDHVSIYVGDALISCDGVMPNISLKAALR